ncbi:MAG: EamA family transporter RarD [Chloroflexota bacterium]|nr:EamA family transporter RarD [Chloroflexota bacterium]
MKKGVLYSIGAYVLWGVFPIYWKTIHDVPALEIISHRVVWSFVFVLGLVTLKRGWHEFGLLSENKKLPYLATAVLLSINWLTYVWGVNAGYIIETSLGYFINPLVSVLLGVIFLHEKLRPWQWISVGLAFLGVLYLSLSYGRLPWIALTLAGSFGLYGLIKKTAPLESLPGFTLETGIMFVPALSYLIYLEMAGRGAFGHASSPMTPLLALTGIATGVPLLWFGIAARQIKLSTLGFLQYIAPTLQFLIGVLVYKEDFSQNRIIGFSIIWTALLIYSLEGVFARRKAPSVTQRI